MTATEELLTKEQLAEVLKVPTSTVLAWARAGKIPQVRLSLRTRRFRLSEVLAAIEGKGSAK